MPAPPCEAGPCAAPGARRSSAGRDSGQHGPRELEGPLRSAGTPGRGSGGLGGGWEGGPGARPLGTSWVSAILLRLEAKGAALGWKPAPVLRHLKGTGIRALGSLGAWGEGLPSGGSRGKTGALSRAVSKPLLLGVAVRGCQGAGQS